MTPARDPLDGPGDDLPVTPARRRLAIAAGMFMLVLILVALTWFVVTNTERDADPNRVVGWLADPPEAVPA